MFAGVAIYLFGVVSGVGLIIFIAAVANDEDE